MRKLLILILAMLPLAAAADPGEKCGIVEKYCSNGPSTHIIDGMEVTRDCWEWTTHYACIQPTVHNTCDSPVAKGCTQSSLSCMQGVTIDGVFQCITEQREYTCKVQDASSSTVTDCTDQQFCVDGKCFDTGSVPDPDFAKAITGMEVAREAGVYVDQNTFQVFKGQDNRCSKSVIKNCCKGASSGTNGLTNLAIAGGSAYAFDVLNGSGMTSTLVFGFDPTSFALSIAVMVVQQMLSCNSDEVLTAVKRDHRLCHYIGEYCSKKINLLFTNICVQHSETYCCFNSKIARIINEAARTQVPGMSWGSAEGPSCSGITIAQFQAMDLSQVDFSEFYADIKPVGPDQNAIVNQAAQKVNSYFGK